MRKCLLIVSDLHVMEKKDSSESRLSIETPEIPPEMHPIEALKSFLKNYSDEIDCMVNLGDVANKSNQACWFNGIRMLREVQHAKNIQSLIHVTGNHDVICIGDVPNNDNFYLPKHTADYPVNERSVSDEYWSKGYCIYKLDHLLFLILNTEKHLQKQEDLNKPPQLADDVIRQIKADLQEYADFDGAKIALMHHHIVMHSDPYGNLTSNDVLDKGDELLRILAENHFKIVIHGHKHLPRIKMDDDVIVFAAGSFSSLENVRLSNADNCFHLIFFDIENGNVDGFIETYKYNIRDGWGPVTDPQAFFPNHVGLGVKRDIAGLVDEIVEKYHDRLEQGAHIKKSTYMADFKCISYLSKKQMEELNQKLGAHSYEFGTSKQVLLKILEG